MLHVASRIFFPFQRLKKQLTQVTSVKDELEERFVKVNKEYNVVFDKNKVQK